MKITFKKHEASTGLMRIGAPPRGYTININGTKGGDIYHRKVGDVFGRNYKGFYLVVYANSQLGIPHHNTVNEQAIATIEEAKAQAKAFIKQHAKE